MRKMEPPNPPYCEAYPALAAANLGPRWRDGFRRGEWYDEKGRLAGQFELGQVTSATLELSYQDYRYQRTEWIPVRFSLLTSPRPSRRLQAAIMCPRCLAAKASLYLVDCIWACRECHNMVTFVTLLTKVQRKIVNRDRLRIEVHGGPKPARATPTYEKKRIKLMILDAELKQLGLDALPPDLQGRIILYWPDGDGQEELEPEERAEIAPRKDHARKLPIMRADFADFGIQKSYWSI